jgi:hypothetical protein
MQNEWLRNWSGILGNKLVTEVGRGAGEFFVLPPYKHPRTVQPTSCNRPPTHAISAILSRATEPSGREQWSVYVIVAASTDTSGHFVDCLLKAAICDVLKQRIRLRAQRVNSTARWSGKYIQ